MQQQQPANFWEDAEAVHTYTRQQAIADGVLVDVSEWASADKGFIGGFTCPVAVTAAVWRDINAIPPSKSFQDVRGRAHDLLWMGRLAIKRLRPGDREVLYRLIMHVGNRTYYQAKLVIGPDDDGKPCVTIMRPDED